MIRFDNNTALSDAAKEVIVKFEKTFEKKRDARYMFNNVFVSLMASLYKLQSSADQMVVSCLKKDIVILSEYFSKEEIGVLEKEYGNVIAWCYEHVVYDGHMYMNNRVSSEYVDLFLSETNLTDQSRVFLPFVGISSIFKKKSNCEYEGYDIAYNIPQINQIYTECMGINARFSAYDMVGDIPLNVDDGKRYDYIFTQPPMLGRKDATIVDDILIECLERKLIEGGECWCVLPMYFGYESTRLNRLRMYVAQHADDYSVQVLGLSRLDIINDRCILRLVKGGRGDIELYDFSDDLFHSERIDSGRISHKLNLDSVRNVLASKDLKYTWVGDVTQLDDQYRMVPAIAILEQNERVYQSQNSCHRVQLNDVIEMVSLEHQSSDRKLPLIGVGDLSDTLISSDIYYQDISYKKNRKNLVLDKNCMVAGLSSGSLKVGNLKGLDGEHYCALTPMILPFRVKFDKINEIDPEYLLYVLLSDDVRYQVEKRSTYHGLPSLYKIDFLSIWIDLPNIEQQKNVVMTAYQSYMEKVNSRLSKFRDDDIRDLHMKKHALGQTVANISTRWRLITKARELGIIRCDRAKVAEFFEESEDEMWQDIENSIMRLMIQVEKFDPGYHLKAGEVGLIEFVEDYIKTHHSDVFAYDFKTIEGEKVDEHWGLVKFSEEALVSIFDDIVSNACFHGFRNEKSADNILKIELRMEGNDYVLLLSNNGAPLHKDIRPEGVFDFGNSSRLNALDEGHVHSGIGGYEINRLMMRFGGEAEFISTPDKLFKVTYKLVFHEIVK